MLSDLTGGRGPGSIEFGRLKTRRTGKEARGRLMVNSTECGDGSFYFLALVF